MQYQITELTKISIHTFLAEGDVTVGDGVYSTAISIHTFLTEGDQIAAILGNLEWISIHTFLAEGDFDVSQRRVPYTYFNPHLPYGR